MTHKADSPRRPLSVWELPRLATLVHCYRKSNRPAKKVRPHFPAVLAFVHRNRLATSDQVRRRFPEYLPSDRTARRHLAELESLGLLGARSCGPSSRSPPQSPAETRPPGVLRPSAVRQGDFVLITLSRVLPAFRKFPTPSRASGRRKTPRLRRLLRMGTGSRPRSENLPAPHFI